MTTMENEETRIAAAALEDAQAGLRTATEAHEREEQRLAEAKAEIANLTREIEETDPDDTKAFARLVAARDAAKGKAEALGLREGRAREALEKARRAAQEAERDRVRAEVAALDAKIREADGAITAAARAFADTAKARLEELHAFVERANGLEAKVIAPGAYFNPVGNRGSYWAPVVRREENILLAAIGKVSA